VAAMRGTPKIQVAFDIDANGILTVTAKDEGTGKETNIRIKDASGLNKDEVERMKRDAESHADEDKRKKELVDARNKADSMVFQIEKMMKDAGDKISASDKAPIESAIANVKSKMDSDDVNGLNQAISQLEQAAHAMAQHMYSQGGQPGGAPSGDGHPGAGQQTGGKGGDDVIDADYEVKK